VNARLFLFALAMAILGAISVAVIRSYRKKKAQQAYARSTEGMIEQKLVRCNDQIEKNQYDIRNIRKEIKDLEDQVKHTTGLSDAAKAESKRLIEHFQRELDLRQAKVDFYETCRSKLQTMLNNYWFVRQLEEKKSRLRDLQETHYEDLADMESMRHELTFDQTYLQTIDKLSLRMLKSRSVNSAQALRLELVELTKDLQNLG